MERKHVLSRNTIKYIAIIAMTLGHIANGFLPHVSKLNLIFDPISQITYPIMLYLLCEGFYKTRSVFKYGLRLAIFGLLAQIPYSMYFGVDSMLNVLFSLLLGLVFLYIYTSIEGIIFKIGIVILFVFPFLFVESRWYTLVFILAYLLCRKKNINILFAFIISGIFYGGYNMAAFIHYNVYPQFEIILLSMCIIMKILAGVLTFPIDRRRNDNTFNISKSKAIQVFSKYFFYAYYPLHITALLLLKLYIG